MVWRNLKDSLLAVSVSTISVSTISAVTTISPAVSTISVVWFGFSFGFWCSYSGGFSFWFGFSRSVSTAISITSVSTISPWFRFGISFSRTLATVSTIAVSTAVSTISTITTIAIVGFSSTDGCAEKDE